MTSRILFIVLASVVSACSSHDAKKIELSPSFSQAVSVCEILTRPSKYVGSEINVVGLYGNAPHQRILYDPSCSGALAVQIVESDDSFRKDRKMQRALGGKNIRKIRAIYKGKIESESVIAGCSEVKCSEYKITNAELLDSELH